MSTPVEGLNLYGSVCHGTIGALNKFKFLMFITETFIQEKSNHSLCYALFIITVSISQITLECMFQNELFNEKRKNGADNPWL